MDIEQRVRTTLEATGLRFEILACDPALADTAEFCRHYGYPPDRAANTILVASKRPPGRFAACVVLATTRLDVNRRVKGLLEVSKLSFAAPEVTRQVTDMEIGGVTPFALPPTLPVYVDSRVPQLEWVIFGAGSRSAKVKADPAVLLQLPAVEVVSDLATDL